MFSMPSVAMNGGTFSRATYTIVRPMPGRSFTDSPHFPVQVILEPVDRSTAEGSRLIALAYLTIGLYVLFRRWTAPKASVPASRTRPSGSTRMGASTC